MPFFNIFSNKKPSEKEETTTEIIIDSREKNSLVPAELSNLGCKFKFEHLKVADYLVNQIAIERKSLSDLKSSIINKRIYSQILDIKQYPHYALLIEGLSDSMYEGIIHENALRGFMLSLVLDYQIPIIFTQNEKDTAKYLSLLARKKEKSSFSMRASKILLSEEDQIKFILEGFPDIGPKTAEKLLSRFGSIKNIINASLEDLTSIIGKKAVNFKSLIDKLVLNNKNV